MKYITKTINSFMSKRNEIIKEVEDSRKIIFLAVALLTSPLAKGRFFLVGCFWSSFMSRRSFTTYMLLAMIQKSINATMVEVTLCVLNWNVKSKGANIKRFFIYWCGLKRVIIDFIFHLLHLKLYMYRMFLHPELLQKYL